MGNKNFGIFVIIAMVVQATWVRSANDVPQKRIALGGARGSCGDVTEHFVGEDKGWTLNVDYQAWADAREFYVGDVIVFFYDPQKHCIVVVDEAEYEACTHHNPIYGVPYCGRNAMTFAAAGKFGFISVKGQDCQNGMKFLVTVKER